MDIFYLYYIIGGRDPTKPYYCWVDVMSTYVIIIFYFFMVFFFVYTYSYPFLIYHCCPLMSLYSSTMVIGYSSSLHCSSSPCIYFYSYSLSNSMTSGVEFFVVYYQWVSLASLLFYPLLPLYFYLFFLLFNISSFSYSYSSLANGAFFLFFFIIFLDNDSTCMDFSYGKGVLRTYSSV